MDRIAASSELLPLSFGRINAWSGVRQIDRANASIALDADPLDIRPIHGSIVRGSTEHVKLRPLQAFAGRNREV
jgi:hypothetical protein